MLQTKRELKIGDVFSINLLDEQFGAFRILDIFEGSYLIATTPYLEKSQPEISHPLLAEILAQNRFYFGGGPAISWVDEKVPDKYSYLGNIPVSKQQRKINCNSFEPRWYEMNGTEAYLEWRWENDREAYEQEVYAKKQKFNTGEPDKHEFLADQENKRMKDKDFWALLKLLDVKDYDSDMIQPVVHKLSEMTISDINEFEETLAYNLYLLDTKEHAVRSGLYNEDDVDSYFSPDMFLYTRCAVVCKGEYFYEKVLKKPIYMPKDEDCEPILYIASEAYELKTGEEYDYISYYDYETFSNSDGWK